MSDDKNKDDAFDDIDAFGDEGFDDDNFEDFESGATLSEMWKENPLLKIGAIIGVIGVLIGAMFLFGGEKEVSAPSYMARAPEVSSSPGMEEVSPVYRTAVEEHNNEMIQRAHREGESALPVPITPPVGRLEEKEIEEEEEDPLSLWRTMQEEQLQKERFSEEEDAKEREILMEQQQQQQETYTNAVAALSEAMIGQMEGIVDAVTPLGAQYMEITDPDYFEQQALAAGTTGGTTLPGSVADANAAQQSLSSDDIIIPAGEIEYAQLLLEANSDVPGPILARIVSGPLSGSRVLGSFSVEEDKYLVLEFNQIVVDKVSYPIEAIALDPDTTLTGMATEIDHRYFSRVILPAAASFIQGVGKAIAESGSTSVTVNSGDTTTTTTDTQDYSLKEELAKGAEEASSKIAEFMESEASGIDVLVRIAPGTPLGILFTAPITRETPDTTQPQQAPSLGPLTSQTAPVQSAPPAASGMSSPLDDTIRQVLGTSN